MLDYMAIFEQGGVLLFEKLFISTSSKTQIYELVNKFVEKVFIEQKEATTKVFKMDKKIIEFVVDKKLKIVYLIIFPEISSQTNFSSFLEEFQTVFEKKYLRNLLKNGKQPFEIWFYREQVAEDLNMILQNTDFTNQEKQVK